MSSENGTFWDHLEVLRFVIIRILAAVCIFATVAFMFKDFMFNVVVFGPTKEDFPTFEFFKYLTALVGLDGDYESVAPIKIINTRLSAQLFTHLNISFWAGVIFCVPYIVAELWNFVRPALYQNEKSNVIKALIFGGILFYAGVAIAYYLILPLSVNFLGNYQVAEQVDNLISLDSYIETMVTLCLSTGIVFELPIVAFFLSKVGMLTTEFMKTHRKHAFLLVLILAAIITPSTDIFTMFVTAIPLQLVYEISVFAVKRAESED